MKLRLKGVSLFVGYEAAAALTAALLLDRGNHVVCCFFAAMLHELGHLLMMCRCGVRVEAVSVRLFDILIEADSPAKKRDDIMVTLGGVAANFLFAILLFPLSEKLSLPNLMIGVFNLLPVMGLDGGHLLVLLLSERFSHKVCQAVLYGCSALFMIPFLFFGFLFLLRSGYNYSLLAIALYLPAALLVKILK